MPVETKVQASTAAAAASGLVLWVLGAYVFRGAVPGVVVSWVYVLVPGAGAFAAGYLARHAPRPDLGPPAPPPVISVAPGPVPGAFGIPQALPGGPELAGKPVTEPQVPSG